MNEPKTATAGILVHLVRPGVEARDYHLAEGATLADLLRQSGGTATDQDIFLDGRPLEEVLHLRDGMTITLVPHPPHDSAKEPWRATISSFQDEEIWQQYSAALKAVRDASKELEEPEA